MSERSMQYRQVIGFFWPDDQYALTPGGFVGQLIRAVCRADEVNRAKMRTVYPHVVDGVDTATRATGDSDDTQARGVLVSVIREDEEAPL